MIKTTIFYPNIVDFGRLNDARHMPDPPPAICPGPTCGSPSGLLVSIETIAVLPSPST